jgi:N,N-dimethylformamidase
MPKPIAYVSDEMYLALPDVQAEFEPAGGGEPVVLRSSPRGAFYGDLAPGPYRVALAKTGYGAKFSEVAIGGGEPVQFRLLADGIIGYMWPKWVRSGETAEYRIHSTEPYQLSLWRYGQKRELIQTITWVDEHGPQANRQILPDGDFTQTGVQWNTIGYSAAPRLAAPERTGLYYLWARTPSGKSFSFPWVVAPAKPQARIAVMASTNTWNAYNNYGGRSNYVNPDRLPATPVMNSRQELNRYKETAAFGAWLPEDEEYRPLSFDRPEPNNYIFVDNEPNQPVEGRTQCGQAPGEWRLYAWLEKEGYGYDLWAEHQLHDGSLPLDSYSVLVIAVHPEYWSREMYFAVKDWVFQRGGRLLYLGGNGLNCEVVFGADGSMRCLSHLRSEHGEMGGKAPDGSEYDSRMHRTLESEANLLGVVCTETGIMTAAPYEVLDASHWIFENTGLQNGDLFGRETLHVRIPGGASGHETDKRSAHSPANTVLLAKGTNPENGGSEIVVHERDHNGAVFSVGSITWVPALLVDDAVSTITRNVLNNFLAR